ncbi:MAG: hypothetical protein ISS72_06185 [Candidatus Brocadiae bacterium]|nr:hypothetical protein [Candidatus Brocadiia bacterium]
MMKLCPECEGKLSDQASRCPHCGYVPLAHRKTSTPGKWLVALGVAFCVVGAVLFAGSFPVKSWGGHVEPLIPWGGITGFAAIGVGLLNVIIGRSIMWWSKN